MVTSTGVRVRGGFETPQACHGFLPSHTPPSLHLLLSSNYYCCKRNDSEVDVGSVVGAADPLSHFPCNTCNALAMDGTAITPVSLDQLDTGSFRNHCPTCSPYPLHSGLTDDMRNGGERLGFHTYYENRSVSLPLSANPPGSSPLSYYSPTDMFPPPHRSYSTQV
ncbi:protein FAM163A-like isoform X1 [Channa argus]|uniref:protein FAM163A-like isoform X1 n=1 Tax=Channa argus TaxID=215402 RepID=UPI003520CCB5